MRTQHSTLNAVRAGAVLGLLGLVCSAPAAADTEKGPETYTWSAELVEFDAATRTATVKARIVGERDDVQTGSLSEGDRAMLTWSGITYGAGIRALEAGDESSFDRMSMPVEFVAEEDGHVVFRVQIPADDADAIAGLEAGQWVTATSAHRPGSNAEAVLSMRPYGDVE
ncbi:MAG TPA: hypothetical protein VF339_11460 [Gammaproteobacteria bacterium]